MRKEERTIGYTLCVHRLRALAVLLLVAALAPLHQLRQYRYDGEAGDDENEGD